MTRDRLDAKFEYICLSSFIQWRNKIYFFDFSFKVYNVCPVKPSYGYCTLQLCQMTALYILRLLSMSDGRIEGCN